MPEDQMLDEHRRSYRDFTRLITWSTAGVIVVLALMAIFLV